MKLRPLPSDRVSRRRAVYFDRQHMGYVVGILNAGCWRYWAHGLSFEPLGNPTGYATEKAAGWAVLEGRRVVVAIAEGERVERMAI